MIAYLHLVIQIVRNNHHQKITHPNTVESKQADRELLVLLVEQTHRIKLSVMLGCALIQSLVIYQHKLSVISMHKLICHTLVTDMHYNYYPNNYYSIVSWKEAAIIQGSLMSK